jgi:predicted ABC-type ATPase
MSDINKLIEKLVKLLYVKGGPGSGPRPSGRSKPANQIRPPKNSKDTKRFISEVEHCKEYQRITKNLKGLKKQTGSSQIENWSIDLHTDKSGNFSSERKKLHNEIVKKSLNPLAKSKKGETPNAIILLGGPGSGKTTAGGLYINKITKNTTVINTDNVREYLPEYKGWNSPAIHGEASFISKRKVLPIAIKEKHNLVIDTVGHDSVQMSRIVNGLGKKGYNVHIISVEVPEHISVARAWTRYVKGGSNGRLVPPRYAIDKVDGKPQKTVQLIKNNKYVKSTTRIDNSGSTAVLINN